MSVVVTGSMITVAMGTEVSKVVIGRDTVISGAPWGAVGSGGKNPSCPGVGASGSSGKKPSCRGAAGTLAARTKFCDSGTVDAATSNTCLPDCAGRAALKLDANKIAATESRATDRVIWSAETRAELFLDFFILVVGLGEGLRVEG